MVLAEKTDAAFFRKIDALREDRELKQTVTKCINNLRDVVAQEEKKFAPNPNANYEVSPAALEKILSSGDDISDIRTNTDLSNCLVFHTTNLDGSIIDEEVMAIRQRADVIVADRIEKLFPKSMRVNVNVSGHFLYPPSGFMGWHTNSRKPAIRFYVTHAEEKNKSFFRYRDPETGDIVTSYDNEWDFRMFNIIKEKPFWHCVYSETFRWSLGYMVTLED